MKLSPPTVEGQLSVCSRAVRLTGQMRGAKIEILVDGAPAPVGKGTADWGDEWFALTPGMSLNPGDVVRATQTLGADSSIPSSDGVKVVAGTSSPPQFDAPLVACSQLAVVNYLTSGATATVRDAGPGALGSATASGSRAEVALNRIVNVGEKLKASMSACGGPASATVESLPAQPMAVNGRLRTPTLKKPLFDCARIVSFASVMPGAGLQLERDGEVIFWTCTATTLSGRIDPPLKAGQEITFWLEPPNRTCEALPSEKTTLTVPPGPPRRPILRTPPCPGTKLVKIGNLIEGAVVTVRADGQEIAVFQAGVEEQIADLGGAVLGPGQLLTVTQALCNVASEPSVPVSVTIGPTAVQLRLPERPVECGLVIRVEGVPTGSLVEVFSDKLKGRIGRDVAGDEVMDVDVTPPFVATDDVTVVVSGCTNAKVREQVQQQHDLAPFSADPPLDTDRSVRVTGVVPGARLDVYVDGRFAGFRAAPIREFRVPLDAPLHTGQRIDVYERLCAQQRQSDPVWVKAAPDVVWSQVTTAGIAVTGGNFHAGRVEAALPLAGNSILVGTEASGLWTIAPGVPALSLSGNWTETRVLCLARGPRTDQHFYCGTVSSLLETDTVALVPLLSWKAVNGFNSNFLPFPGSRINALLVLPGRNVLVIATNAGVWSSPIPATSATGYQWSTTSPVNVGNFVALARGPNESVVAYRNGGPSAFFVGAWSGPVLGWTNTTPGAAGAPPDARLTSVASRMTNGALDSCAADRSRVYAAVADEVAPPFNSWLAVLRSDDGGLTWQIPYADAMLNYFNPVGGVVDLGFQAERNMAVGAHPLSRDTILLASRRGGLLGSTNGGVKWDAARWPAVPGDSFHGDSLCITYESDDPTGNTVIVGGDGGLFVSRDLGVTWDTSCNERFPTLMFDQEFQPSAPALSASPGYAGLLVGALQDNGNVFLTGPGQPWQQLFDGGDGQRALFVTSSVVLRGGNDAVDLKWARWDGSKFTDPVPLEPPGYPANSVFMPGLCTVPYPTHKDGATAALLRAVAGDDPPTGDVFGLFDRGAAHNPPAERFFWQKLGKVPFEITGVGSLTGRTILVGTTSSHIYRLDAATGAIGEMALPVGIGSGMVRWPTMAGGTLAFAMLGSTVLRTTDLSTWIALTIGPSSGTEVIAVDRARDPVTLFATGINGAWYSRDLGDSWRPTKGLPARPQANHLEVVDYGAAGRWIHLGTWNWSAWRAQL